LIQIVRETSVRESACPGNVRYPVYRLVSPVCLRKFRKLAPVVTLIDGFTLLMPRVYFQKEIAA